MSEERCEECGLPTIECGAIAAGRLTTEQWMRNQGYPGLKARKLSIIAANGARVALNNPSPETLPPPRYAWLFAPPDAPVATAADSD